MDRGKDLDSGDPLFPWNAVVGVVDDPGSLEYTMVALRQAGFADADVDVLCGQNGIERIDAQGEHKGLRGRLFRVIDSIGAEQDQTERHGDELREGHFLVVAKAHDEAAKERALDAMVEHGAHYINYYSRWTTEELAP